MFDPDWAVNEMIDPKPAPYALGKVRNLEYIKLDYFTIRGCREAQMDNYKSISHDTLTFTQLEDTIAICPLASLCPSKHTRNDEDLSWEEMLGAKNMMLSFMAKLGVWPIPHMESLAVFYINLELHPRAGNALGKWALLLYQS